MMQVRYQGEWAEERKKGVQTKELGEWIDLCHHVAAAVVVVVEGLC